VVNRNWWRRLWKKALAWGSGSGGRPLKEKKRRTGLVLVAEEVLLAEWSRVRSDDVSPTLGGGFLYSLLGV
jgi:hypothetical protein